MLYHMQVMRERITMAYDECLEAPTAIHVFGPPNHAVFGDDQDDGDAGSLGKRHARHLSGFTRVQLS